MKIDPEDKLLTPGEVAALFRVHVKTVQRWGDAGRLGRMVKTPGGWRRFYETDVRRIREGASDDLPD